MGFSWVTFIAQIVNLFILVYLLKRFLYQPVINAISKRQAYIEDKVKQAELSEEKALKEQALLEEKQLAFDAERQEKMDQVISEIKHLKQDQETTLATELKNMRHKMQDNLDRETKSLEMEIRNLMVKHFMDLVQKTMVDLSGLSPINQAITLFKKKVSELSKAEKESVRTALNKKGLIRVLSSCELSSEEQGALSSFLSQEFEVALSDKNIHFGQDADLILGIEMSIGDLAIDWNLKSYLDTFSENLNASLSGLIIKKQKD